MEHTKGPWKCDKHMIGDGWRVFVHHIADNDSHDAICDLETWQTDNETEANARLIAAAPELLEACKAIAALANSQGRLNMLEVAGQAKAAIAKADGRS